MRLPITVDQLKTLALDHSSANLFLDTLHALIENISSPIKAWQVLSKQLLSSNISFPIHLLIFNALFPQWHTDPETAPAWMPSDELTSANIAQFMSTLGFNNLETFHEWTATNYAIFWQRMTEELNVRFKVSPTQICDLSGGIESPQWFPGAALNIADSCFTAAPSLPAIIYADENNHLITLSYDALNLLSNRIANSLLQQGFQQDDPIAIAMPMNHYAVAIYLGIIKMGGIVVSIADSFSTEEIATRLQLVHAKAIFTQDVIRWGNKTLPLYDKIKIISHNNPDNIRIFVTRSVPLIPLSLAPGDCFWEDFLLFDYQFTSVPRQPMDACNLLFSSGTTGAPKVIVWNHTTPIKVAADAFFHQNIQPGDVLAWPTNLGWMMGPWLIFAALMNHATLALFLEAPKSRAFGEFIQNAKVTMLGVVPTLVSSWRQSGCMEKLNWDAIKVFSSSGECSNPEDMLYLMSLANYKPIIEYCGGTEIGGGYLSSTVIQHNYPSLFSTPTMGLSFRILDEKGHPATLGEVAIIPPSIGLSTSMLNGNHHQVYYENMPKNLDGNILRRHGDQIKLLPEGHYSILGRVDDTMNLGGIKISSAEIEHVLMGMPDIIEIAAIAVTPAHFGPNLLVIYAATGQVLDKETVIKAMQKRVNTFLNPLFKINDVVFLPELPKTASNKIMRRVLRQQYQDASSTA